MRSLVILCLIFAAPLARAGEITVFAASSLFDALTEVVQDWEAETGHSVRLSFAGTSTLAVQIARGAPADIFIAADPQWMDHVSDRVIGRSDLVGNSLVLIAHGHGPESDAPVDAQSFSELGDGPLAMALTEAVPAGRYGRAALEAIGVWDDLPVAETANVRAALALVASGAAPMGVVYASDAATTGEVRIVAGFPTSLHPDIVYPVATLSGGAGDRQVAAGFMSALQGAGAQMVFVDHGFLPR